VEQECTKLRTDMDTLKQEKAKVVADREADLAGEQKSFRDYSVGHNRKLHDLHVELEGAMNQIGARCLLYPKKGSTISEITVWFTEEIQALPNAIAKANKNFLVYCLVGILKMLQEHAQCSHMDGLETNMAVCDASIIDEVPDDIEKLSARIVKWWSSYVLPYVIEVVHIESEVRLFDTVLRCLCVIALYL
jgi:hypothetical protein